MCWPLIARSVPWIASTILSSVSTWVDSGIAVSILQLLRDCDTGCFDQFDPWATVGTSGGNAIRSGDATASTLSLPPSGIDLAEGGPGNEVDRATGRLRKNQFYRPRWIQILRVTGGSQRGAAAIARTIIHVMDRLPIVVSVIRLFQATCLAIGEDRR